VTASLLLAGGVAMAVRSQQSHPAPAAPPTDLGRRIPLGTGFDSPWLIVQTAGCGYKNYAGGALRPNRQTCRMILIVDNPGQVPLHLAEPFAELVDDRGDSHRAASDVFGPMPVVQPGERLVYAVKYGMRKERRPARLEGRLVAGGSIMRVVL
jgi:hypothetical protein